MIVGKGDNPLSAVYAGVVADAAILAARDAGSRGEAYNITSQGRITQREFLDLFADALQVPRVTPARSVPAGVCGGLRARGYGIGCCAARGRRGSPVMGHGSWDVISNTAPRKLARGWGGSRRSATPRASSGTLRWFLGAEARRERSNDR